MYQIGQGVELDLQQSAYWYKKSADLGYVHSMRDIGQSYLQGLGVEKSPTDATRYFEMASSNNYSHGTGDLYVIERYWRRKNFERRQNCPFLRLRKIDFVPGKRSQCLERI